MRNHDLQNLPDGYRLTELGPLPEECRVVRLGEVASTGNCLSAGENHELLSFLPMARTAEGNITASQQSRRPPNNVHSEVIVLNRDLPPMKLTSRMEIGKKQMIMACLCIHFGESAWR